jgi:hypothetical protein
VSFGKKDISVTELDLSPDDIRKVVKSLTGEELKGVIQARNMNGKQQYLCQHDGRELVCFQNGDYWFVSGPSANGAVRCWSNDPGQVPENRHRLLERFIAPKEGTLNPKFHSEEVDLRSDIRRTRYQTAIGPVRLHSRRMQHGIEFFIEVEGRTTVLKMFWQNNEIVSDSIKESSQHPF